MTWAYTFAGPGTIVFGWGCRRELAQRAATIGRRAILITGSRTLAASNALTTLVDELSAVGIEAVPAGNCSREPEVADVDRIAGEVVEQGVRPGDFILAIGGGSAMDLGKAVAAMATNRQSVTVRDYLEGVGRGLKLTERPLPVVALPTTAGTGAEATKNAVLSSYDPPFKKSLRDDGLLPRLVLVDPELTVTCSPEVTAHSGMDAITQLIESYISCRAQPIPQALAVEGLRRALPALAVAVREPTNQPAREAMAHAALLSGMALANSGLGMAHGVAAALGVHARAPHGLACAMLLPATMRANLVVARRQFAELARTTGVAPSGSSDEAAAEALVAHVTQLAREVGIPSRLRDVGVRPEQLGDLVRDARGNSMSGNPRPLADDELLAILGDLL